MKKGRLSGWQDVFQFTILQNIKNKSYIVSTVIVTILIGILCVGINLLPAIIMDSVSESNNGVLTIGKAYIIDESGLSHVDYSGLKDIYEQFKTTEFIEASDVEASIDKIKEHGEDTIVIHISQEDIGFNVDLSVSEAFDISEDEANVIANMVLAYFKQYHAAELGITAEQVSVADMQISSSVTVFGEEDNFIEIFVEYMLNCGLIVVAIILLQSYARMAATAVATEKSSKVIELLLTSIRPVATIMGKIIAMSTLLIGQLVLWVAFGGISFVVSGKVLETIDPKYGIGLSDALDLLTEQGVVFHFDVVSIIVALLVLVSGFTVYIAIAAFVGAWVSKIEELGQAIQSYSFLLILGAYIPLFGNIAMISDGGYNNPLLAISRIVPLCSPFVVPIEVVLGTISIPSALLSLSVSIVVLAVLFLFISKVYESVILYSGNRLKLKDVMAMFKMR